MISSSGQRLQFLSLQHKHVQQMLINVIDYQDIAVIRLPRCEWAIAYSVGNEIIRYVEENRPKNLILDFTQLDCSRRLVGPSLSVH